MYVQYFTVADTVLELFREAVTTYGLPSRIRIDNGGVNIDVAMYLLTHPAFAWAWTWYSYCWQKHTQPTY